MTMKANWILSIAILVSIISINSFVDCCQACLAAPLHHSISEHRSQIHHRILSKASSSGAFFSERILSRSILNSHEGLFVATLRAVTQSIKRHPTAKPILVLGVGAIASQRMFPKSPLIPLLRTANDGEKEKLGNPKSGIDEGSDVSSDDEEDAGPSSMTAVMVGTIGIYKNFISPLLPPACRFLPTCSQYGVQAIEEFGPTKGCILTAWRLMRCTPFGGKGYDPPKWPPVPYNYGSY